VGKILIRRVMEEKILVKMEKCIKVAELVRSKMGDDIEEVAFNVSIVTGYDRIDLEACIFTALCRLLEKNRIIIKEKDVKK